MNDSDLPELERRCEPCEGRGRFTDVEEDEGWYYCQKCNGSGFVPTAVGARILDLIRHNSRVTITAALEVASSR